MLIRRHFFLASAIALVAILFALGLIRLLADPTPRDGAGGGSALSVSQTPAAEHAFADRIEALGVAKGRNSVTITSDTTELVTAVRFRDGQNVGRGQVLVELKANEQAAGVADAQARLAQAKREYDRWQELADRGVAPRATAEQYQARYESALAIAEAARAQQRDRVIRAPFSGTVGLTDIAPGALVSPGSPIVSLDDLSVIRVDFDVPDRYLPVLRPGAPIDARPDPLPGVVLHGRLAELDTRVNPETRAIRARATFPNGSRLIRPGMMIRVGIEHGRRTGVAIPESAIQYEEEQAYVFVVAQGPEGPRASKRRISIGATDGELVEVTDGLRAGERVVTGGLNRVRDGQRLRIAEATGGASG